ncbi:MAG TPA: hypothetical protein VKT26_10730 [Acetobacteraceae bacterium]|nr:hypothetical protein [Acetobacteraceae bacterium]
MPVVPNAMLPELLESQATGDIAAIYDEIRRFSGVPYVSSLQRYLATLPTVLESTWHALRPAMASGVIPETGWQLAADVRLRPATPVQRDTLPAWGIDEPSLATIRAIAENFVRVSPVNLVFGACLHRLLTGETPSGTGYPEAWTPPAMLPPMPGNVDPDTLPQVQRAVLMRFATDVDGVPFIPALYRQLAHWPSLLAWLADELVPRLHAPETNAARKSFQAAARAAAGKIVTRLPATRSLDLDADTRPRVLAAIDRYAQTSPEMTMFGRIVQDALPFPAA